MDKFLKSLKTIFSMDRLLNIETIGLFEKKLILKKSQSKGKPTQLLERVYLACGQTISHFYICIDVFPICHRKRVEITVFF